MGAALDGAVRRLGAAGVPMARREAELLAAWIVGRDRGGLIAHKPDRLDPGAEARFEEALRRRERRCPLQYIVGEEEFRGLSFRVDSRVLIPRPETELVVDAVLDKLPANGGEVADLGTGSGCIAIAIAVERPGVGVLALDASAEALDVARLNARRNGVGRRVSFVRGDIAVPPTEWRDRLDVVVSNPPYVSEQEWLELAPEVRDWEPKTALVAGATGDEAYGPLARAAWGLLRPSGWLVAELGHTNGPGALDAAREAGFVELGTRADWRGIDRVLLARRP